MFKMGIGMRPLLCFLRLTGFALCALYATAVKAEGEEYFNLSLEQLLEIQISTVSKKEEPIVTAPAAIYVVTSEDIQRSGITTIPDALRLIPGMNVARSDSNSWAVSIRGFNSTLANKLLVLMDGRTIYNPVFGGVLWEAHDLILQDIERIEVIRGPGGTLWGANAVNGVVNIITKTVSDTQGTVSSVVYGNEERIISARYGGALDENRFYRVYAKAFKRDGSESGNGDDNDDQWKGIRGGFRIDWGEDLTVQGDAYHNRTRQRIVDHALVAPYSSVENQTITYEGMNLLMRWQSKQADGSGLSVQSYIDWARRDEPYNFIDDRITYDIELQYDWAPIQRHEIVMGAGFRFLSDDETGNANVSFSPSSRRNKLYSAFVQDKIMLAKDSWYLTLGSKFEHNDFSGFELQPSLRLQWLIDSSQSSWAAISKAVRTPTPIEQDLTSTIETGGQLRVAFVPNEQFQSEELTAYEIGYRVQLTPSLSADLVGFYNQYDALQSIAIEAPYPVNNGSDPVHFLVPVKFTNGTEGNSHGVESVMNWMVSPDLKVALDYSYLHLSLSTELTTAQNEALPSLYPQHQLGLKTYWNISQNWTLDTTVAYVDKLQGTQVEDYTRMDVNLGGQISQNIRFNLVGQNMLKSTHQEFGNDDDLNAGLIERSIFVRFTFYY